MVNNSALVRSPGLWMAAWVLAHRELLRFWRDRGRLLGALGTPILFWLILGSGIGNGFRLNGQSLQQGYLEYFFPGSLGLVVLFTSIFSSISLILDRREGFLQSVLISPAPGPAIVGGKILGGAIVALLQGLIMIAFLPSLGFVLTLQRVLLVALSIFAVSLGLTAFGTAFAWRTDSVQGYHAIMNLILFPMWLVSGSFFPMNAAPWWLQAVMALNPMTYAISAFRSALYYEPGSTEATNWAFSFGIIVVLGLVFYAFSIASYRRSVK